MLSTSNTLAYTPDMLPSNPNSGMCYARVEIPAEFTTTTEDVLVEEGYTTVEVSNPQLASRQERVLVKEASVRYEVKQPTLATLATLCVRAIKFIQPLMRDVMVKAITPRCNTAKLAVQRIAVRHAKSGALLKSPAKRFSSSAKWFPPLPAYSATPCLLVFKQL